MTTKGSANTTLPLLAIKTSVLFPELPMPLSVGRPISVAAARAALATEEKLVVVVAQRDPAIDQPKKEDLHVVGTRAVIKRMNQVKGGYELLVHGVERVVLDEIEEGESHLRARVRPLPMPAPDAGDTEFEALHRTVLDLADRVIALLRPRGGREVAQFQAHAREMSPILLAYTLGTMMSLDAGKEQALLEAPTQSALLKLVLDHLGREVQVLELRDKIASRAQSEMGKEQRDYLLRQQLRAIQEELGDRSPEQSDVEALRTRLKEADLPDDIRKEADRDLERLAQGQAAAPDYQITRAHLELILELPWRRTTEDALDLPRARQVLDEDHYDLEEVKDRILEHLAVMKLNPKAQAPILCFVGPPGVGKTSLGQSIARALGRKFERMSLGGLHDEGELRGHRRTYIGAMPGRIVQAIRRAGVSNPVLMLDEVDKLGRDFRGDPAAALLEVLDPAQNSTFRDNYLDLPFDLSKVFFVTTANALDPVPRPLLDRMEVLRLSGYSHEEKAVIARRYLIPRRIAEAGLRDEQMVITDETLQRLIAGYTREAGVRQLERAIGSLARKVARRVAEGATESAPLKPQDLAILLGPERFLPERARRDLPAGVATGLAWTETGGEVLTIESTLLPSGHGLRITGSLGDVMRESAKAAQSFVWSHAEALGIPGALFRDSAVHVHVPAGAVPKDGPSAGVALVSALASLYTGKPIVADVAMTGEITLSGLVLPVGGIKEKVLAARRAGIHRVVLPRENEKDLAELPPAVREAMDFVLVDRIEDALAVVLQSHRAARRSAAPNGDRKPRFVKGPSQAI
ncbi:MAG: endopeptidase La [Planctomycetes bacterium]|nr:endopeptidase La [Planctomycetota bacterium]MBI3845675.1 endopeptidase La [Planctomycetota bacterium]